MTSQRQRLLPGAAIALSDRRRLALVAATLVAVFLLTFPLYGTGYQMTAILALSMILGIEALSLIFLAGYGGMVSLAQTALAGLAAYTIGILTVSHSLTGDLIGFRLFGLPIGYTVQASYPWWAAVLAALLASTAIAFLFGVISVRSQGIYFLMITLALAMIVFYFAEENYTIFNGHGGIGGERAPSVGGLSFDPIRHPRPFYYLVLVVAALVYFGLRYVVRSPFGLAMQGVRDNPRRMRALGFWVEGTRVAAFTLAGFIAGIAGVLYVWYYETINPVFIDLTHTINILIIAVIGGLIYFEGAFVGALAFTLVTNFASSYTDRYNTVIGLTFLLIVLFSPNGLIGLPETILRFPRTLARFRTVTLGPSIAGLGASLRLGPVATQRERPRETGPPAAPSSSEEADRGIEA
jgi:branched-chain amino acid transport system permease protein